VWRVISVDGHPVRGAFTFAVGPNAGPAPQFKIPSLSETAATPKLITARWAAFISFMAAIGLFVLRMFVARPLRSPPRALSIAFWIALVIALVATPVYVLLATAEFAVRSFWSWGALFPLLRTSAFGRGYLDLELVLALFAVAAAIAFWVDRPDRDKRSIAELLATGGALAAAAAAAFVPGIAGHAAQTSPRGLAVPLDGLHVLSGSLWVGGLIGLLVVWAGLGAQRRLAGLAICVPRFSNVALTSVIVLFGSGVAASVLHLPTLASLWQTSYGEAIIVKASILLGAIFVASFNLFKTVPGLRSPVPPPSVAGLLRALVSTEVVLVAAAVAVAAVLSSLPPPPKALASIGSASAHTGPGRVTELVSSHGYQLQIGVNPNRAAVPNQFALRLTKNGRPVTGATVTATFTMLDMEMQSQIYKLSESSPGLYEHSAPALVMVGHWGISYGITPPGGTAFNVLIEDRANG
jgi:copper transport protein